MPDPIRSHRDLHAWQHAVELSVEVYRLTAAFPTEEKFGLTNQLRRGSVSVPSNIAEGYGRGTTDDYLRFLRVARGALYELDTQIVLAQRLSYLSQEQFSDINHRITECGRVLAGLIRSVEK